MNPLLDFEGLPRFAELRPEHVAPALDQLLAEGRATVARVSGADVPCTWDAFVTPLEDANELGDRSHICTVCSTARRCATPTTRTCRN
jgi:Zn-dependent oligopeptidase